MSDSLSCLINESTLHLEKGRCCWMGYVRSDVCIFGDLFSKYVDVLGGQEGLSHMKANFH